MQNSNTHYTLPLLFSLILLILTIGCYKDKEGNDVFFPKAIDTPLVCVGQVTTIPNKSFCRLENKKAVYFPSGFILIVGGCDGTSCNTELIGKPKLWDVKNQTTTNISSDATDIFRGSGVTRINNTQAIITGGSLSTLRYSDKVYLYDDDDKTVGLIGRLASTRAYHTATFDSTNNQLVLIGGLAHLGNNRFMPDSIEVLQLISSNKDAVIDSFQSTTYFTEIKRHGHTANLLPDGDIIIIGGCNKNNTNCEQSDLLLEGQRLKPNRQTITPISGILDVPLFKHQSIHIEIDQDPFLILLGGEVPTGIAQFYSLRSNSFDKSKNIEMNFSHSNGTATLIQTSDNETGDKVLLVGGDGEVAKTYEVYHSQTHQFIMGREDLPNPRTKHIAISTQQEDKEIIIMGGLNTESIDKYTE